MGWLFDIEEPPSKQYFDIYDDGWCIEIRKGGLGVTCSPCQSARFRVEERFNLFEGCRCVPDFIIGPETVQVEVDNEHACPIHKFYCLSLKDV
jgi:hypothetical protein